MARNGLDPHSPFALAKLDAQLAYPPKPPYPLSADQITVWDMIVETRAPEEWSGIDEFLAADLCVATVALRDARLRLATEDLVTVGPRGGSAVNPLMAIISSLVNQTLRLSGRLRLGILDAGSEDNITTAAARKRMKAAEVRDKMAADDPDLILRPKPTATQ